jgi:hypothetical protein
MSVTGGTPALDAGVGVGVGVGAGAECDGRCVATVKTE